MDDPDFERKLAEFSKSNRHRWAIGLGVASIALIGLAIVLAVIAYISPPVEGQWRSFEYRQGQQIRLYIYAVGALIGAVGVGWMAIKQWRGRLE